MPTVKANGIEMYYERHGSGEPLTLIMGLACSARQWKWMVEALSGQFEVIVFDNRGVGRTDKPDEDYTTEQMADDTAALLDAIGVQRTHLMGASAGGMVAQQVALRHPGKLRSLILGCTMPSFSMIPPTDEDVAQMALGGSHDIDPSDGADAMLQLFLTAGYLDSKAPRIAEIKQIMIGEKDEQGPGAFWHQFNAIVTHDVMETIGQVKTPTLIMVGSEDPIARADNARFLHEHIQSSELKVYEGLRHAYWVEAVEQTTRDIVGFIGGLPD